MSTDAAPGTTPPPRLLDALRTRIRYLHYSLRTEEAYVHWVRAYIRFHELRHPAELAQAEVEAFLTWLAAERQVDLLVMGAVSRSRLREIFLGSTAERVLDHLPCDVLVIKSLDFREPLTF